jgi:hypothetical protein
MEHLMIKAIAVLCLLAATTAFAQQPIVPAPPFVPFTISQSDYQSIQNWLGEQPAKFSIPVLTWLQGLEQKAQEDAKKAVPAPDGAKQ